MKRNLKSRHLYGVICLFLMMLLIVSILAACGSNDNSTPVTTANPTDTTTVNTPTTTPIPTSTEPVKIGLIADWSGPTAMIGGIIDPSVKVVEWQLKQQGGILGGRDLQVVKYDDKGSVPGGTAGATKLLFDEHVSALLWASAGGESAAVSQFAEENKILYVTPATGIPWEGKKYTITTGFKIEDKAVAMGNFVVKELKAKKVGLLSTSDADARQRMAVIKDIFKPVGIDIVYDDIVDATVTDYSPLLSKIKYANPDVLLADLITQEGYVNMARQMPELGGWGDIKVIGIEPAASAVSFPGANGWYILTYFIPGNTYPASLKFENDFKQVIGKAPGVNNVVAYNLLWAVIHAIKLAGTDDREAIVKATFSGNLQWDSPLGIAHWTLDHPNFSGLQPLIGRVEGGKLVSVGASGAPTPTAAPSTAGTGLDINSAIGELVANERTAAVLEKWVPGLTTNPKLMGAYSMTIPDIAPMKTDMFTAEVMAGIEKDLAAIK